MFTSLFILGQTASPTRECPILDSTVFVHVLKLHQCCTVSRCVQQVGRLAWPQALEFKNAASNTTLLDHIVTVMVLVTEGHLFLFWGL